MARTTGQKNATKATSNAGQGAKAGMTAAVYKPTAKTTGSDRVAKPVSLKGVDIRGVKATGPKANPMYPGKPSSPGKTTKQYGSGLLQGKAPKGFQNEFPDQKGGAGRPVSGTQKGQ